MVKRELEAEPVLPGGGVIGPKDFLPPTEADIFKRAIMARNVREKEDEEQHRRSLANHDDVLLEQGLAKEKEFADNQDAWRPAACLSL